MAVWLWLNAGLSQAAPPKRLRPVVTKASSSATIRRVERRDDKPPAPSPDEDLDPAPAPDDLHPPAPLPHDDAEEPPAPTTYLDGLLDSDDDAPIALVEEETVEEYDAEQYDSEEYDAPLPDLDDAPLPADDDYLAEDYTDEDYSDEGYADEEQYDEPAPLPAEDDAEEYEEPAPLAEDDAFSDEYEEEELADEEEMTDEEFAPDAGEEEELPYDGEEGDDSGEDDRDGKAEEVEKGKSEPDPKFDGLTPVAALQMQVVPAKGEFPRDLASQRFEREGMIHASFVTSRPWAPMYFSWEATALCHSALYFEEPNLERLGYSCGVFQPAVSAAHFFGTIPALPYLMAAHPQKECVYTLGQYRAGSHAPLSFVYPRIDPKAALLQGGVVAGLILLIP
ncbi:MAG: hypothetical protein AB7O62_14820 [Pirellulales bacterium]